MRDREGWHQKGSGCTLTDDRQIAEALVGAHKSEEVEPRACRHHQILFKQVRGREVYHILMTEDELRALPQCSADINSASGARAPSAALAPPLFSQSAPARRNPGRTS